jgi:hypothetical protein
MKEKQEHEWRTADEMKFIDDLGFNTLKPGNREKLLKAYYKQALERPPESWGRVDRHKILLRVFMELRLYED